MAARSISRTCCCRLGSPPPCGLALIQDALTADARGTCNSTWPGWRRPGSSSSSWKGHASDKGRGIGTIPLSRLLDLACRPVAGSSTWRPRFSTVAPPLPGTSPPGSCGRGSGGCATTGWCDLAPRGGWRLRPGHLRIGLHQAGGLGVARGVGRPPPSSKFWTSLAGLPGRSDGASSCAGPSGRPLGTSSVPASLADARGERAGLRESAARAVKETKQQQPHPQPQPQPQQQQHQQ